MADIFYSHDAQNLCRGQIIYFIGDSNVRALYKDFLCLLLHNRLITAEELKLKAEITFLGDKRLRGSPVTKGRHYREDRRFLSDGFHLEFHFTTRCLNENVAALLKNVRNRKVAAPNIIVMNSTLWDVNRWGPSGVETFKENLNKLIHLFKSCLPPSTLVIWVTAPPLAVEVNGGFMIQQLEFAKYAMRFQVMEANLFAQRTFSQSGYNVLDFHHHLSRLADGMHWTNKPMRHMSNLLLTHISLALGVQLPGNRHSLLLQKHQELAVADVWEPPGQHPGEPPPRADAHAHEASLPLPPPPPLEVQQQAQRASANLQQQQLFSRRRVTAQRRSQRGSTEQHHHHHDGGHGGHGGRGPFQQQGTVLGPAEQSFSGCTPDGRCPKSGHPGPQPIRAFWAPRVQRGRGRGRGRGQGLAGPAQHNPYRHGRPY